MQSTSPVFTVSAFGPFGNVTNNPTMELINSITQEEQDEHKILLCRVLEVSTEGCQEHISAICKLYEGGTPIINLHLGVYAGSETIHLETCGYNLMDFRIPDVRGCTTKDTCIRPECDKDCPLQTRLDLNKLLSVMKAKGHLKTELSTDPGRYICNYIYYCSLNANNEQSTSLFVHVPLFDKIPFEEQKKFLLDLLVSLKEFGINETVVVKE